jgi:hypothetical protein
MPKRVLFKRVDIEVDSAVALVTCSNVYENLPCSFFEDIAVTCFSSSASYSLELTTPRYIETKYSLFYCKLLKSYLSCIMFRYDSRCYFIIRFINSCHIVSLFCFYFSSIFFCVLNYFFSSVISTFTLFIPTR